MTSIFCVLTAIGLFAASGLPGCFLSRTSALGQRISAAIMILGGATGLAGLIPGWAIDQTGGSPAALDIPWTLPWGSFSVAIDSVSTIFLLLVFVVPPLGAVYGLGYWKQKDHPENGRKLGLFYGLLTAALALLLVARDGMVFILAWEVMSLCAFFAATAENEKPQVRRAGWIYLVMAHVSGLVLCALFLLWTSSTGSSALVPAQGMDSTTCTVLFVLALAGFGIKAGLVPLHIWLPGAHSNAPSHVSAIMSGIILKMGVYGMVRVVLLLPMTQPWWGPTLLMAGTASALVGIVLALGQRDLKRILAYSSVENLGIIFMGLGLGLMGRFWNHPDWVVLGLGGALLHTINHGLFKPLLFWGAGGVIHATGTKDIEALGGLGKFMPRTLVVFVVGTLAISALPPLNGFVSEWLIYLGLFRTLTPGTVQMLSATAITAAILAMTGALALLCFVRLVGTVFSGEARSPLPHSPRDPGAAMMFPLVLVSAACVAIGVVPALVFPLLDPAVQAWAGIQPPGKVVPLMASLAPPWWITGCAGGLIALVAFFALILRNRSRKNGSRSTVTWDCGYALPTPRMQYTGTSLSQSIIKLFAFMARPRTRKAAARISRNIFPEPHRFSTSVPDPVLDRAVIPGTSLLARLINRIRFFQQGQTQLYILYMASILVILLVLMLLGGL